jgi:hypothetical protein
VVIQPHGLTVTPPFATEPASGMLKEKASLLPSSSFLMTAVWIRLVEKVL